MKALKLLNILIPILVLTCSGCEKQEAAPDFREAYCGTYRGLYTFYHITGSTDEGGRKFICEDCPGPPDYAEFLDKDSVVVFIKSGVTNSRDFYGKKQYQQ